MDFPTEDTVPGDSSTTFSIPIGGSVVGYINDLSDEDWYRVDLTAGETYFVLLEGTGIAPLANPFLTVMSEDTTQLVSDDNSGPGLNAFLTFTANQTATYFFMADAFQFETGEYTLSVSVDMPLLSDPLLSIDWGTQVSLPPSREIDVYFAHAGEMFDGVVSLGWTAHEIAQALDAYAHIANVTDVTFRRVMSPVDADLKLVTTDGLSNSEYANPPGFDEFGEVGVTVFNRDGRGWDQNGGADSGLEQGGFAYGTLLSLFGLSLGMAFPHIGGTSEVMDGVTAPTGSYGTGQLNQGVFTTMSDNNGWETENGAITIDGHGFQATMMALDIAVLQQKYGANASYNSGNTTYTIVDQNGSGTFYESIWDTGGVDTLRYDGARDAVIDLRSATLEQANGGGGYVSFADGVLGGFTIAADKTDALSDVGAESGVIIEIARGGSGDDTITGNDADNILLGNSGNDTVSGRGGDDRLEGGAGFDILSGGDGNDYLFGGDQADTLHGDSGNDVLLGESGNDRLFGGNGGDTLRGGNDNDALFGGLENDYVFGDTGNDVLWGEDGNDRLDGGIGFDNLIGGNGNDSLFGGDQADTLTGQNGNDYIAGQVGNDRLFGGAGFDQMFGGADNDRLFGGGQADRMLGNDGDDLLFGESGNDQLIGGAGEDVLDGGADADGLIGNFGDDTFVFVGSFGRDTIRDFDANSAGEKIDLSGVAAITDFADLQANHLAIVGGKAQITVDANNLIVIDNLTTLAPLDSTDFVF